MGDKADRYFIPAAIGFAPFIFALLTWPSGPDTQMRELMLVTALPVTVIELFVIVVALRDGLVTFVRGKIPRPAAWALVLWLAAGLAASVFVAPLSAVAIRWTAHWIIHLSFGFSVAFLGSRQLRTGDLVLCYLAGFLLYSLAFLVFVIVNWTRPIDWVHYLPAALHIRHVAIYAAAMTGMAIGLLSAARTKVATALAFAATTIGFSIGFWTGARGMVLSVIGATVLAAAFLPAMRRVKVLGLALLALGIALAAVAPLPTPNAEMMGVARQVAATTDRDMTTGRVKLWSNVVQAIKRNPILGYGPGQMPVVAPFYGMGQPHNLVLQLLLDWGIVGFLSVIVASFFYLRRAIPAARRNADELAAPAIAVLSLLLLSLTDAAMFHVLPVSIFAACAGMLAANSRVPSGRT